MVSKGREERRSRLKISENNFAQNLRTAAWRIFNARMNNDLRPEAALSIATGYLLVAPSAYISAFSNSF